MPPPLVSARPGRDQPHRLGLFAAKFAASRYRHAHRVNISGLMTNSFSITDKDLSNLIHAREIRKAFGSIQAVAGLSFDVRQGETFGLLGPNGAGKSTTIGVLVGLIQPDQGEVLVDGAKPSVPSTRMKIGVAPQALALYDELTAQENLSFFGQLYGLHGSRLRERIRWALELAGLTDRARHRVSTFSGGMKRRLNIAVAMVHDPQILLLDEPTVGVDPQSRSHIFDSIESLRREGLTVLYTTHYMEEAERLCDRVAIVDHGKLMALDTVADLIAKHGGTSQVTATVDRWPDAIPLPGTISDGTLRFAAERPLEKVAQLSAQGATFHTLQINSPNLESVFLSLTGRSLRD
jgi:ABC-2 type transport system ATP-binding protein